MTADRWAVATITAKPRLAHARALAESLAAHHPAVPLHVLLADDVEGCFDPSAEAFELHELGSVEIPAVREMAFRYDLQQFSFALAPAWIERLLDGYERVVYIKHESLVLGTLDPLLEALDRLAIVLTPHLLAPLEGLDRIERELNILLSGVYNLGVLGVADRAPARDVLRWWGDRLTEHCVRDVAAGLHFEQRWMDLAPSLFEGVGALRDPTVNVGHWNVGERNMELHNGHLLAQGEPCRLMRFSGHEPADPSRVSQFTDRLQMDALGDAAVAFGWYADALARGGDATCRTWPYAFDRFADGVPIPDIARDLYRELGDDARRFGDPFAGGDGTFRAWLVTHPASGGLPPLWERLLEGRPDVRNAYADPAGEQRPIFAEWARSYGCPEHGIATELAPAP